eukprot:1365447-Alexandrium_andersonii.AAC.1
MTQPFTQTADFKHRRTCSDYQVRSSCRPRLSCLAPWSEGHKCTATGICRFRPFQQLAFNAAPKLLGAVSGRIEVA